MSKYILIAMVLFYSSLTSCITVQKVESLDKKTELTNVSQLSDGKIGIDKDGKPVKQKQRPIAEIITEAENANESLYEQIRAEIPIYAHCQRDLASPLLGGNKAKVVKYRINGKPVVDAKEYSGLIKEELSKLYENNPLEEEKLKTAYTNYLVKERDKLKDLTQDCLDDLRPVRNQHGLDGEWYHMEYEILNGQMVITQKAEECVEEGFKIAEKRKSLIVGGGK